MATFGCALCGQESTSCTISYSSLGENRKSGRRPPARDSGELYPSIRKLPLLGVSYADLYRRTKVQEAVFETLTQEYELAKVAEAKEIPSVKVLDPPNLPERKSFPPRLTIMLLGALLGLVFTSVWVLTNARWKEIDPRTPHKVLAQEVLETVHSSMPWATPNGSRFQAASHRLWVRMAGRVGTAKPDQPEAHSKVDDLP